MFGRHRWRLPIPDYTTLSMTENQLLQLDDCSLCNQKDTAVYLAWCSQTKPSCPGKHIYSFRNNTRSVVMFCPTVCVTRWWAGRENATLPEPASSHAKSLKTRRLPPPWHLRSLQGIGCIIPMLLRDAVLGGALISELFDVNIHEFS